MIDTITKVNGIINDVVWGTPALTLLIGTGVIMTVLTGFFQFTHFGHTMKVTVVCTMTALLILTSGVVDLETGVSVTGATKLGLATEAFTNVFGTFGGIFIAIAVTLFAFSTVLGWSYYGTKAWEYLFGTKSIAVYKVIFLLVVLAGSTMGVDLIIDLSDTFNGLMAIPNLIGVLSLAGTVMAITRNYRDRIFKGEKKAPMLSHFPEIQKEHEDTLSI